MPPDRSHKEAAEEKERPLASSCTSCRGRKIKCCSSKPVCKNCQNNGSECEYKLRQKPGLKQGVGGELLKRVDILEEQMAAQAAQLSEVMRRLEGSAGAPALPSAPSGSTPTAGFTPGSIISTISFGEGSSSLQNVGTIEQVQPSVLSAAEDLPPHDLLMSLIEIFFHHVHPFAPFLRREQLQLIIPPGAATYQWPIQLYAVVACSLRFSHDDRWTTLPPKAHYHQLAKDKVVLQSMRSTSIDSLEALVLIALDDVGGTTSPTSWGSLALATRTTGHVGLHHEQSGSSSPAASVNAIKLLARAVSPADEEERRRLWWTTFILDRWSSSSTGWDFAFADETIHRRLPCDEGDWHRRTITETPFFRSSAAMDSPYDLSEPLDRGFTALVQTADLLGLVHQLHRRPLVSASAFVESSKALESALTHWYNKISPAFVNFGSSPLVLLVQALHFSTVIKLMSLLAYPLRPDMTPDPRAGDKAQEAALSIANIARLVTQVHSPYGSWAYFVAARMLILRAHRKKEAIAPVVDDLVKGLESAAVYFDMAKRYHSLISRALRRLHDDGKSAAISVLVDLHHTAFSADHAALPSGQVTPNGGVAAPPLDLSALWGMDMDYQTLSTGWFDEQGTGDPGLFDTWLLTTNA